MAGGYYPGQMQYMNKARIVAENIVAAGAPPWVGEFSVHHIRSGPATLLAVRSLDAPEPGPAVALMAAGPGTEPLGDTGEVQDLQMPAPGVEVWASGLGLTEEEKQLVRTISADDEGKAEYALFLVQHRPQNRG